MEPLSNKIQGKAGDVKSSDMVHVDFKKQVQERTISPGLAL